MTTPLARYARSQGGYTLIEVIIAGAIGAALMAALTSVILTSVRATTTATSRVEASSQIRSFEYFAYDDFARSAIPPTDGCGTPPWTCPIALAGIQVSNSQAPVPKRYAVTYSWDQAGHAIDRQVGSESPLHAAVNISAFSWYLDTSTPNQSVIVSLTVTFDGYSESETMRFYPRLG